ncbi:hypothetical protein SB394_04175 [Burkholderia sp. BCCIQ04A]|uniref:Uncharacterized protein n=1 Tax=Burkholderia anthinoferrum TaxID=3090833 RepID=A0ABU5WF42_9BURK|nr:MULTISPECIES: hypothetical protein [Burkholderia]MEB2502026.1 hypothetical protein [Burkholderia anthinoferrum]MEB2532339.1 hypothetical protein [Burkholderia anthinoferrum]MEB2563214.1 hypothetical protein [Burkholderia anthinoferrum]MEB2577675.1 hypothetical protein [Burkholderia anthinoferrum]MCA8108484.1 hypothetical protein [Burkholderia sp. AU36459]
MTSKPANGPPVYFPSTDARPAPARSALARPIGRHGGSLVAGLGFVDESYSKNPTNKIKIEKQTT